MTQEKTTQIALPEGMTLGDFNKAFASFQKQRVSTAIRDKAGRAATKELVQNHKPEYDRLLEKYLPKA